MKLAFCLFTYSPWSGLARDFLRIIEECHRRGHKLHVYVREWHGERPPQIPINVLKTLPLANHARDRAFYDCFRKITANQNFDAIIGFKKMPGLDMYYCGDACYTARAMRHGFWYRLSPRFRHFETFERAVFGARSTTSILSLAEREKKIYQEYHGTPDSRFKPVPPNLDSRRRPFHQPEIVRRKKREELMIPHDGHLLLFIGSGFRTKGLDRAIRAMAALPTILRQNTTMLVLGQGKTTGFERLAARSGLAEQVRFLGGRDDVVEIMAAGDLLIHPARSELSGSVLIEAIAAGLPVLATDVCGYAHHIIRADAGSVSGSPFVQQEFNQQLQYCLTTEDHARWRENAVLYGKNPDFYRMPETVSDLIEETTRQNHRLRHDQ